MQLLVPSTQYPELEYRADVMTLEELEHTLRLEVSVGNGCLLAVISLKMTGFFAWAQS